MLACKFCAIIFHKVNNNIECSLNGNMCHPHRTPHSLCIYQWFVKEERNGTKKKKKIKEEEDSYMNPTF